VHAQVRREQRLHPRLPAPAGQELQDFALSEPRLQRRLLAWLWAHDQRFKGTLSHSLANLEAKGLVTITRTSGGKAEAVDLTSQGRQGAAQRAGSCDEGEDQTAS
jgi:hypothetical protein